MKKKRLELGMSQRRLASISGISNSEISRIEAGVRKQPSPSTLSALSMVLNVPYDTLMREAGHLPPESESFAAKMPEWVCKLPSDLHGFVKEESSRGWPYMRLARAMSRKNLSPSDLEAIVAAWMEAKSRYDKGLGVRKRK